MKVCDPHTFLSFACQKKTCQTKSELRILTETCTNQKFTNLPTFWQSYKPLMKQKSHTALYHLPVENTSENHMLIYFNQIHRCCFFKSYVLIKDVPFNFILIFKFWSCSNNDFPQGVKSSQVISDWCNMIQSGKYNDYQGKCRKQLRKDIKPSGALHGQILKLMDRFLNPNRLYLQNITVWWCLLLDGRVLLHTECTQMHTFTLSIFLCTVPLRCTSQLAPTALKILSKKLFRAVQQGNSFIIFRTQMQAVHRMAFLVLYKFLLVPTPPGPRGEEKGWDVCSLERTAQYQEESGTPQASGKASSTPQSCIHNVLDFIHSSLKGIKIPVLPQSIRLLLLQQVTEKCWARQFIWIGT